MNSLRDILQNHLEDKANVIFTACALAEGEVIPPLIRKLALYQNKNASINFYFNYDESIYVNQYEKGGVTTYEDITRWHWEQWGDYPIESQERTNLFTKAKLGKVGKWLCINALGNINYIEKKIPYFKKRWWDCVERFCSKITCYRKKASKQ